MTGRTPPNPALSSRFTAPHCAHRRAFTLVDIIATIVVISLIATVTSSALLNALKGYSNWSTRSDLQSQLASTMDRIVVELRNVAAASGVTPVQPDISSISPTSITFNADTSTRTITLSGTNLTLLGATGATANLATNISSLTIQAYDKDNNALATTLSGEAACAGIRRIQITMTATNNGTSQTLRTKVFLPCMALGSGAP